MTKLALALVLLVNCFSFIKAEPTSELPSALAPEVPPGLAIERHEENAVDFVSDDGIHFIMPYDYRLNKPLNDRLLENVRMNVEKFFVPIEELIVKCIGLGSARALFLLGKVGAKMVSMAKEQRVRDKALGLKIEIEKSYSRDRKDFFVNAVKQASKIASSMVGGTDSKAIRALKEEAGRFVRSLRQAFLISPVGPYVNFTNTLMDGEPFYQSGPRLMAKLEKNGLGPAFYFINKVLTFLSN